MCLQYSSSHRRCLSDVFASRRIAKLTAFLFISNIFTAEIPNILMHKSGDDNQHSKTISAEVDYDSICNMRQSNSISDFTSILENNNTMSHSPTKVLSNADCPPVVPNTSAHSKKRLREGDVPLNATVKKAVINNSVLKTKGVPKLTPATAARRVSHSSDNTISHQKSIEKTVDMKPIPVTVAAAQLAPSAPAVVTSNGPNVIPVTNKTSTQVVSNVPVHSSTKVSNNMDYDSDDDFSNSSGSYKTEECFKGVAQAAVTNLIMNASSTSHKGKSDDDSFQTPVDTSSAHVAALTSTNWVAACAASVCGAPPGSVQAAQAAALAAANDPAAAKAARARRATLTADERARQNRDRNREHARNTRLRKKAYVEELKRTLTELVSQRDAADLEKRLEKQRDLEVREVRYRVMEEFLKLRARGAEPNLLARWVAILEDGFTLTLPKTTYRSSVHDSSVTSAIVSSDDTVSDDCIIDDSIQVLCGANDCFDDASKACSYISTILNSNSVQISYQSERVNFIMDGIKAVLDWTLKATPQVRFLVLNR